MKNIVVTILALLSPITIFASSKLIEKSGNTPAWRGMSSSRYFCEGGECFLGRSKDETDPKEAFARALSNAFSAVSKHLNVEIKSVDKIHEEIAGGVTSQYISSTARLIGATVMLNQYKEERYLEKWDREGSVVYDAYIRIIVPSNEMRNLRLRRDAVTSWGTLPNNSCNIRNELNFFISETGIRKGLKMTSDPVTGKIEDLSKNPKTALHFLLTPVCSERREDTKWRSRVSLTLSLYDLTTDQLLNTYGAKAEVVADSKEDSRSLAIDKAKTKIKSTLFSFASPMNSPQMPDLEKRSVVGKENAELLQLYDKAYRGDLEGWLFPEKAIDLWKGVISFQGENPYKETAESRIEKWEIFIKNSRQNHSSMENDKENLSKIMPLMVIKQHEKIKLLKDFIYRYSSIFGIKHLYEIVDKLDKKDDRIAIYRALFSKRRQAEWEKSCERNDGAACYILGSFLQSVQTSRSDSDLETKRNDELFRNYYRMACNAQIGAACKALGETHMKEKNGGIALDYLKKSCLLGHRNDCFRSGHILYSGRYNLKKDIKNAFYFLNLACRAQHKGGCYYIGFIYEHGEKPFKKSRIKANQFYKKSCDFGYEKACSLIRE